MNDVKLTDFTHEELKTLHVILDMHQVYFSKTLTEREQEIMSLWRTQLMNAAVQVKMREEIASN